MTNSLVADSHDTSCTKMVQGRDLGARWVPSPTGIGIGMLVPAAVILVMFVGGVAERLWWRAGRRSNELYMVPLASGFIAGKQLSL